MNRILIASLAALSFTACTKDFEELNTDPNRPAAVPTAYLITSGERGLVNSIIGEQGTARIGALSLHYVQYLSQTQYTDATTYNSNQTSFDFIYSALQDLEAVKTLNVTEESLILSALSGPHENQIAVATILQQWAFLSTSDVWGDIPYSEALQGKANISPAYDTQEDVYRGAVTKLVEATEMIVPGAIDGDVIFGGDMDKWKLFANSVILRAGLRVSNVDAALGEEWTKLALDRGVMTSNDDIAQLAFPGTGDQGNNQFFNNFRNRTDYAVSEPIVNYLKALNDPRLSIYAQPTTSTAESDTFEYTGMVYGITQEEAGDIPIAQVSFPGTAFISASSPTVILTYSEVLFNQAEAAARGWTSGDAEALYDAAVTASMAQYGITDADAVAAYLAQDSVAYDESNFKKSIGNQKWLALYFQGVEGWSEYRRLGYPELTPAPAAILTPEIPRRRAYATEEFSLNQENYVAAVKRQFGDQKMDLLTERVWWDVMQD